MLVEFKIAGICLLMLWICSLYWRLEKHEDSISAALPLLILATWMCFMVFFIAGVEGVWKL